MPDEPIAGGGLLHRRTFLKRSLALAGTAGLANGALAANAPLPEERPPWMMRPGKLRSEYGQPSPHESEVTRSLTATRTPGAGSSGTPHQHLTGIITPSGLHFERHHSGVPQIDPARHRVIIHGLVRRPLVFTIDALGRYPMRSHLYFLECSGNSWRNTFAQPMDEPAGVLHGLVSCSEWTGVSLAALLDEAGLLPEARWIIAEGADSVGITRSVPLAKALDDVLLALYQNGERIRPEQGYPVRLFVPGWEGNVSIKWVHRIEVTRGPAQARDETSKYTDLLPDGRARQFSFPMGVKSVITHPSGGQHVSEPGVYEISGIAWSGHGAVRRVEVSADGGRSWAEAVLDREPEKLCLARFRIAWRWNGGRTTLMSRATDDGGNVQPSRDAALARFAGSNIYHFNGIQSWSVEGDGRVRNVFA
jgi:sulfane dehydrogenase subunit SoxC